MLHGHEQCRRDGPLSSSRQAGRRAQQPEVVRHFALVQIEICCLSATNFSLGQQRRQEPTTQRSSPHSRLLELHWGMEGGVQILKFSRSDLSIWAKFTNYLYIHSSSLKKSGGTLYAFFPFVFLWVRRIYDYGEILNSTNFAQKGRMPFLITKKWSNAVTP